MTNDTNQQKTASKNVVAAVGLAATLMATALPVQAAPVDGSFISDMIAFFLGQIEPDTSTIVAFNSAGMG